MQNLNGETAIVQIFLISNSTGQILVNRIYSGDFYPGGVGSIGDDGHVNITCSVVLPGVMAIQAAVDDNNEVFYSSIVGSDLSIKWQSPVRYNAVNLSKGKVVTESFTKLNDSLFLRRLSISNDAGANINVSLEDEVYNTSCNSVKLFSLTNYNTPETEVYKQRAIYGYPGGHFLVRESETFGYRLYNSSGAICWQKDYSEGSINKTSLNGCLVMQATEGGKPVTKLISITNGNMISTIPHEYLWNDEEHLLCYGINSSGTRDGTIRGFNQLQGLQYLKSVINGHTWDSDKMNFIVSVTDADQYKDFTSNRDSIISLLKANHLKIAVISPSTGQTKTQAQDLALNGEGGWWINTNNDMSVPLDDLAQKIIDLVNKERGADNVVIVNDPVELSSFYKDSENDPAYAMRWEFTHDPNKLGTYNLSNPMGLSSLNGAALAVAPTSFDKAGTYTVKCRAQDDPVTNTEYKGDAKAGRKWSNNDGYLTIIAHRRPVASFTCTSNTTMNGAGFTITDSSYDPDLVSTDPEGKKGIRTWEWQYRLVPGGEWITSSIAPNSFPSKGNYNIRLRVQDVHGAWSNWCEQSVLVVNQPPIAIFETYPNPVSINNNCMLIDHSYDLDGDTLVAWNWTIQGIGTRDYTNADSFSVSWPNPGDYTVTLKVQEAGGTWSAPYSLIVRVTNNHKPVAVLDLPAEGYAGETFMSDGTGSYDPDAGDYINLAYWQYKKPGGTWSDVYTAHKGDTNFLKFYSTPIEIGTWTIRLTVVDSYGLESDPVEKTIEIKEGFEVGGYVTPDPGERGRKMRVTAYAYRKGNPGVKLQINSMTAYIVHQTKPDGAKALPDGQVPMVANMAFDAATTTYKYTFLVPDRIQSKRWPDDGDYYIRIVGQKNSTQKEALIPCTIKGHILNRIYIQTRSW
jgi:hypothetical protein